MIEIVGDNGSRFVIAAAAVALGLLFLIIVLWFMRNRPSSPFIRGGKNRQPRLAVLDAAAIDTRRRLVLVRRDDVEHLLMIGGPTDVVIESRIIDGQSTAMADAGAPRPVDIAERRAGMPELEKTAPRTAASRPQPAVQSPPSQPLQNQPAPSVRAIDPSAQPARAAQPVAAPVIAAPPMSQPAAPVQAPPVPQQGGPSLPPTVSAPPVSAMGQVLYGDIDEPPLSPSARPTQPVARPAPPADPSGLAKPVTTGRSPEDILEAARSRVLATPAPAPQAPATNAPAGDFERILDAQISSDLGRLDVGPQPVSGSAPAVEIRAAGPRSGRQEPSIEDEMNRMLDEMANNRKP